MSLCDLFEAQSGKYPRPPSGTTGSASIITGGSSNGTDNYLQQTSVHRLVQAGSVSQLLPQYLAY